MQSKPPTWQSYVAEAFAWVLLALAWVVSYTTQVDLIEHHKFAHWQAIIWPAGSDLASLCCMLLALDAAKRGLPSWEAWAWSGASAGVMIAANAIADWGDPLAVAAHAWLPILAVGVWHYLVIGRRPDEHGDALLEPVIEARTEEPPDSGPDAPRLNPVTPRRKALRPAKREAGRGDMRQRVARLLEETPDVTVRKAAELLGVSPAHAGRLLREAKGRPPT